MNDANVMPRVVPWSRNVVVPRCCDAVVPWCRNAGSSRGAVTPLPLRLCAASIHELICCLRFLEQILVA